MEKNNGRGIFYGVIGVATLVVAIIGATFAYFASTGNTANNAIQANTANIANYDVAIDTLKAATGLIPVKSTDTNFPGIIGSGSNYCVDKSESHYPICGVYKLTIKNNSDVGQQTYVTLNSTLSGFANLKYAIYDGTSEIADGSFTAPGTKSSTVLIDSTTFTNGDKSLTELNGLIASQATKTYYIVIWLEETDLNQNDTDKGGTLAAGITVSSSADGSTGVTALLVASGE